MNQSEVFHKILPAPCKPGNLPFDIHWLSGEGCGSWFHIENNILDFTIARFDPEGKLECKGVFRQVTGNTICLDEKYEFTYLSHCAEVNIIQYENKLKFSLVSKL